MDPDDWSTGDEPMTGPTLAREAGRDVELDGMSKADAFRLLPAGERGRDG
jgi:hypothetical protein